MVDGPSRKPRILVVDDEEPIRKIVTFQLHKAGYEVWIATDGDDALRIVDERHPDLILLDVMMPNLDGYEACKRLKSNYETSHIPIIMVTAKSELENRLQGFEDGANDYITKPFAITELLVRVKNVLQWSQLQRQANPLTGLPGNVSIERELERRMSANGSFSFLYADIDNFKAFNDYYGYSRGDEAIKITADIIVKAIKARGNPDDFVGHIGGDDFVVITSLERSEMIARQITSEFDKRIVSLFDPKDIERGFVEVINRKGTVDRFPLLTMTVALVSSENGSISHMARLSDIASELKRYGKTLDGSVVVKERRKDGHPAPISGVDDH